MAKLIIIDGYSVIFRFFYALPLLTNRKGLYTNAIFGFTKMLQKILHVESPTHMLIALDTGREVFRHQEYAEYKGGRLSTPTELSEQLPYIIELLDRWGIPHYQVDGFEADDIIGTVAHHFPLETMIISGDKDLLQLVNDRVTLLHVSNKGMDKSTKYDQQIIAQEYGLTPTQIIDLKGLMGDPSDNIPGVPGVGQKTATKLLQQFTNLEQLLESIDDVPGAKLQAKLRQYQEQAKQCKRLATICTEVPLPFTADDLLLQPPNVSEINQLLRQLEFTSLLLPDEQTTAAELTTPSQQVTTTTLPDLVTLLETSPLIAIQVMAPQRLAPVEQILLANYNQQFAIDLQAGIGLSELKQWLADANKPKIVYDLKTTSLHLASSNLPLAGCIGDILLSAYLLDSSTANLALEHLCQQYLDHPMNETVAIWHLYHLLEEQIKHLEMNDLLYKLELPTAITLAQMEQRGIKINQPLLQKLGQQLHQQLIIYAEEIYELAGEQFNIASPKQLSAILFDKLGLPVVKKTKTGFSTNADVLDKLAPQHEIVAKIVRHRQVSKLLSTYVEGLSKEIADDGKIHTQFNQTVTTTGRLSSSAPNLQNIPIRLEEGRQLRQIFVPHADNWSIVAADYSQIELRVLAHLSRDPNMIAAFADEQDIHQQTAIDVFHVQANQVTSAMRRQAKAINFGISYGISDYGLAQNIGVSRKEAGQLIDRYFETYPNVRQYMDETIRHAQEFGYVETLLKRRRYIPDINADDFNRRSFAERAAINMPVQGSAADIIKRAMVDIADKLSAEGWQSRLLLQVHDELIFEAPAEEEEALLTMIRSCMENAMPLLVPLRVDINVGKNWYEAK